LEGRTKRKRKLVTKRIQMLEDVLGKKIGGLTGNYAELKDVINLSLQRSQ